MASLKTQHGAIGCEVNRESAVALPQIFTIGDRRSDGGFACCRHLGGNITLRFPSIARRMTTKNSFFAKLNCGHGAHGLHHCGVIRWTKWLEKHFTIAFESDWVW